MNVNRRRLLGIALAVALGMALLCAAGQALYTVVVLQWARGQGVYETPQQGVVARANRYYCGVEKVDIQHATTNSFDGSNPHIWYVIWQVHARNRAPCDPAHPGPALYHGSYENAGSFYLNARDGWVMMPEGFYPELVGFWMRALGLAGAGDPTHIHRFSPASFPAR